MHTPIGESEVIEKNHFQNETYPVAITAIESTDLPGEIKQQIINHLKGAYRSTFRRSVKILNGHLKLGLSSADINRIVIARNALVHEGKYRSSRAGENWSDDYRLMIWINFVALCRLIGYRGKLPQFHKGHQLEI